MNDIAQLNRKAEFLGYKVEKIDREEGLKTAGYHLIGKKATYTLWRRNSNPNSLYATNSNGNVCGIKGNYTFSDKKGYLECIYS